MYNTIQINTNKWYYTKNDYILNIFIFYYLSRLIQLHASFLLFHYGQTLWQQRQTYLYDLQLLSEDHIVLSTNLQPRHLNSI